MLYGDSYERLMRVIVRGVSENMNVNAKMELFCPCNTCGLFVFHPGVMVRRSWPDMRRPQKIYLFAHS
jgi:hypothetical protein